MPVSWTVRHSHWGSWRRMWDSVLFLHLPVGLIISKSKSKTEQNKTVLQPYNEILLAVKKQYPVISDIYNNLDKSLIYKSNILPSGWVKVSHYRLYTHDSIYMAA